jgi:hypothetical protein
MLRTPYIEYDFGPIFVIHAFVQKPFQCTAWYVMKFEIHPPLTSPTDISTDFYALPKDRRPVGGAGGRMERHLASLGKVLLRIGLGPNSPEPGGGLWFPVSVPVPSALSYALYVLKGF